MDHIDNAPLTSEMKVYGWQSWRRESRPAPNGSRQTREICAAPSKAAVARAAGVDDPRRLFNLCETGNESELKAARAKPGKVMWRPMDDHMGPYRE